jgi:hypothetical protein
VPWKLTIRCGSRVQRSRYPDLDRALDALESHVSELAKSAPRQAVDLKLKRFEPIQQVVARLELAGPERLLPTVRAGIDVRGDGSTEAYLGRVKRKVVEQRRGETPCSALRRALTSQ